MITALSLFCPNCNTLLIASNSRRGLSSCPSCGQAIGTEQRTLQKITLPFESEKLIGLTSHSDSLWIWGTQSDKVQLLQFNLRNAKTQGTYPSPNNWQVSGLALTEKVLILSPSEANPPSSSKSLVGIQPGTGKVLWEHATSGFMFTPPAANEELACAVDSHGMLIVVNPVTGKASWASFPQLGDYPHHGIHPVLSQNHVLAVEAEARGAGLVAFQRASGKFDWKFNPPENARVDFPPAVWSDSAFVLAGEWLYRVSLADGTWTRLSKSERKSSQGWYFTPPVVHEERVYLLEANFVGGKPGYALHARDSSTGQSVWQLHLNRRPYQPPALSGEHVFFVDREGELSCLNKQDGQIVWQEHLGAEPADAPIVVQDAIFVLTKDATLHTIKLSNPVVELSKPPDFYEKQGEWALAAGAYLARGQPFEAGLSLLKMDDYRQANLAFNMLDNAEQKVIQFIEEFTAKKRDTKAAELLEDWGMILLERLGEQAQGNTQVAEWFEQAAESYMLANQTLEAFSCRERAAQVMETPRIKLEVITSEDVRWIVNESVLLQVAMTNIGYGPARRISLKVSGNIKRPYPSQSFMELAVDQTQQWENIRVIPNSVGAGLLEFILEYESYRSGQVLQARFTHPIRVEKNRDTAILRALQSGAQIHIEKYISPGATHNEIEITDSQGIAVGDQAQIQPVRAESTAEGSSLQKENQMDPVTLIVSALVGGLTAGLTDTAQTATKDIYDALKSRLMKKTEKNEDAQDAIVKVEKQPDSKARQELLKEELSKLELDQDDELLKLAQSLLNVLKESGENTGKYNVDIQNSQGIVVGDQANVTQNFGDTAEKKKRTNK
jgi:outer membrane protein assembly factor BamB/primosomal replication protein N